MKNLVAKAGVAAVGSALLLTTAGIKKADALFIQSAQTFSVSADISYKGLNTNPNDLQFRSYDPVLNPDGTLGGILGTGRHNINDSDLTALAGYSFNAGGDVSNMAIVGSFTSEEVRGMTEFNLQPYYQFFADLAVDTRFTDVEKKAIKDQLIASAAMNFDVFQLGGIHPDNQHPLDGGGTLAGLVRVLYYQGNGQEDLNDYGDYFSKSTTNPVDLTPDAVPVDSVGPSGTFATQGFTKGQHVSLDISTAVADALNKGWSSLGFRLQAIPATSATNPVGACAFDASGQATGFADCSAITFNNFAIGAVPTPAAILPTLFGMGMAAIRRRKNQEDVLVETTES